MSLSRVSGSMDKQLRYGGRIGQSFVGVDIHGIGSVLRQFLEDVCRQ